VLVLLSAVAHAGWNFIAKQASGVPVFNWLFDVMSVAVWAPLGLLQIVLQPPRLGTVEVRALDAQSSIEDTAGLVALVHCLARHAAGAEPGPDPAAEVLEEGAFLAARYGVGAQLPDPDGRLRPVRELLDDALALARGHAEELQCADELDVLAALLDALGAWCAAAAWASSSQASSSA